MVQGCNLRFTSVESTKAQKNTSVQTRILLLPNGFRQDCVNFLIKCERVLRAKKGFEVSIKLHPALDGSFLKSFCKKIGLTVERWITNTSVQDAFNEADVILTSTATVSYLEGLSAGIPTYRVGVSNWIDLNACWEKKNWNRVYYSAAELEEMLTNPTANAIEQMAVAQEIKAAYFEPISTEKMKNMIESSRFKAKNKDL